MKEKWKNLRIDVTFTAVLAVLLGVLSFPGFSRRRL